MSIVLLLYSQPVEKRCNVANCRYNVYHVNTRQDVWPKLYVQCVSRKNPARRTTRTVGLKKKSYVTRKVTWRKVT